MGFEFDKGEKVESELRRIAVERIDAALEGARTDLHEGIHAVRKRCKEIRALLRLVRAAEPKLYARENARFRDLARRLSDFRDAHALLELVRAHDFDDALGDRYVELEEILVVRRDTRCAEGAARELDRVATALGELRPEVAEWRLRAKGFDAFRGGLEKSYRRGRDDYRALGDQPEPEVLHEWRKRSKYHRYHLELLNQAWPETMSAREDQVDALCEILGDDQDLARFVRVLEEESAGDQDLRDACAAHANDKRKNSLDQARALGARIYAEKPARLSERIRDYWRA